MREILFRGKREDNGEWIEGNLFIPDKPNTPTQICIGTNVIRITFDISPETVGQFTGLTDKNGKRIFEGDILRYSHEYPDSPFLKAKSKTNDIVYCTGDVFWSEWRGTWAVSARTGKHSMNQDVCVYSRNPNRVEVIGNIHDNPELLEGTK